jgi:hypothetical protein
MNKRTLFTTGILSLFYTATMATKSQAGSFTYNIPEGVSKLKIKSYDVDGKILLNYTINVEAGQKFEVATQ